MDEEHDYLGYQSKGFFRPSPLRKVIRKRPANKDNSRHFSKSLQKSASPLKSETSNLPSHILLASVAEVPWDDIIQKKKEPGIILVPTSPIRATLFDSKTRLVERQDGAQAHRKNRFRMSQNGYSNTQRIESNGKKRQQHLRYLFNKLKELIDDESLPSEIPLRLYKSYAAPSPYQVSANSVPANEKYLHTHHDVTNDSDNHEMLFAGTYQKTHQIIPYSHLHRNLNGKRYQEFTEEDARIHFSKENSKAPVYNRDDGRKRQSGSLLSFSQIDRSDDMNKFQLSYMNERYSNQEENLQPENPVGTIFPIGKVIDNVNILKYQAKPKSASTITYIRYTTTEKPNTISYNNHQNTKLRNILNKRHNFEGKIYEDNYQNRSSDRNFSSFVIPHDEKKQLDDLTQILKPTQTVPNHNEDNGQLQSADRKEIELGKVFFVNRVHNISTVSSSNQLNLEKESNLKNFDTVEQSRRQTQSSNSDEVRIENKRNQNTHVKEYLQFNEFSNLSNLRKNNITNYLQENVSQQDSGEEYSDLSLQEEIAGGSSIKTDLLAEQTDSQSREEYVNMEYVTSFPSMIVVGAVLGLVVLAVLLLFHFHQLRRRCFSTEKKERFRRLKKKYKEREEERRKRRGKERSTEHVVDVNL